jgi:DNA-binding transcriptional regulator YhcF (GntR family)
MNGWIKIYRQITDCDLYMDDRFDRTHAWIDLLLLANNKDKIVRKKNGAEVQLQAGDVAMSIRSLAERWHWSVNTVQAYLNRLETDTQIQIFRSHAINVIRIVNWAKYQQTDTQNDTRIDTDSDTQTDTQTDTHREKEENIYISSSTTIKRARAREENPDYIAELKASPLWLEQMAMKFHLSPNELTKRLNDFALDLKCRGTEHRNLNDTKRHFCDWLRIQIQSEKRQQQDETNRRNNQDKRRGAEVTATKAEDYEGAF